jgi:3-deoxy-D-manno-octulosonic-acid transferase
MKYFLNPDVLDSTSAWAVFVKRLCFKLILIRSHISNYRDRFYTASDLPAIIGYIPLKTRRMINQSPGTILISALGFGEIINSINLIRGIKTLSSYPIVIISRQPQLVRQLTQSMGLSVIALPYPYHFCVWRPFISSWLNTLRPASILCIENMIELRADMFELAKARYKTSVLLINAHAYRKSTFLWHILEETKNQNKRRFKCVDMAGVASDEAKKYLLGYGVPDSNIIMVNNLKFDTAKHIVKTEESERIRQQLGISRDAQVLICGSVHPGEEIILLTAFRDVISRPELENIRLIIATREL